jgi:succinate dehydrogenase / fumarate reductase flavoprotein subunit
LPTEVIDKSLARLDRLNNQKGGANVHETRLAMQRTMQKHAGVFRFKDLLKEGVTEIMRVAEDVARTGIQDKSKVFNTARIEALELDNLIEVAKATMVSAEARKESRGAHVRNDAIDTPETPDGRDDKNWLKHTIWYREGNRIEYKPVHMQPLSVDTIELKKRSY